VLDSLQYEPQITERRAILRKLSDQLDETVSLSVPQGTKLIYFDRVESHWPFQVNLKIGDPLPLHCCASGKLYLSSLGTKPALDVIRNMQAKRMARNTITGNGKFAAELQKIEQQGYALDNEEWFNDMVGASVPIKNKNRVLCACLSTHALITRKSLARIEQQIPEMLNAARDLERLFFDRESPSNI
ncbi:MAG: IclR family transcriptional regulator, partial [Aestuariivirgaceae bacterium]